MFTFPVRTTSSKHPNSEWLGKKIPLVLKTFFPTELDLTRANVRPKCPLHK